MAIMLKLYSQYIEKQEHLHNVIDHVYTLLQFIGWCIVLKSVYIMYINIALTICIYYIYLLKCIYIGEDLLNISMSRLNELRVTLNVTSLESNFLTCGVNQGSDSLVATTNVNTSLLFSNLTAGHEYNITCNIQNSIAMCNRTVFGRLPNGKSYIHIYLYVCTHVQLQFHFNVKSNNKIPVYIRIHTYLHTSLHTYTYVPTNVY